jgi:phage tail sheath protein FI
MGNQVFVSPGVYTSEKDLTFVTRQVGVTTLGMVGETTIGPAFQPIFISNYGEFQSFFGGLNATKIKDNGAPQYELPYIAKSYLSQANQLFVTRVLGFSGYDAGLAWGLTLDGALDPATVATTGGSSYNPLISYTATSAGTVVTIVSADPFLTSLLNDSVAGPELRANLAFLGSSPTGTTSSISNTYMKTGSVFSGISFNLYVNATGTSGANITGTTTGVTIHYSGTPYADVENQLVALLRSRGSINTVTQLPAFEITGTTGVVFDVDPSGSTANPLGEFSLSGNSTAQGLFDYSLSMDRTQKNYLPRVLGRTAKDGNTALFVEELYGEMFKTLNADGKIRGLKQALTIYSNEYADYNQQYQPAVTPYVVSELRGNKLLRLFRLWTISDGNAANEQFKISIRNIKPNEKEFDIVVRGFYDTDAQPVILESFSRCSMDPNSNNYIKRRIGTLDGEYASKSSYILVECDDTSDTSDAFPAGFVGYPIRDYQTNSNTTVVNPDLMYKQTYSTFENKRKFYLGISETVGIDADFFDYKGIPQTSNPNVWTGMTNGFHMDVNASAATIDNVTEVINGSGGTYSPTFLFDTGDWSFTTDAGLVGGPYEKIYARKFTFVPYGGYDGWDIYRTRRSNTDRFIINGTNGQAGLTSGAFSNMTLTNGDLGINSDYYAYLEAIWTFKNPEAVNINVFATPGIDNFDNTNLIEATIDMIETDRADSLYIMTTPDTDGGGTVLSPEDVVDSLDGMYDSNYSCTYWPWVQIADSENNVFIYVPPTRDVVRNIALTDNIAFPWFAAAGIQRGPVDCIKPRVKLTLAERDTLYDNRINPVTYFTSDGTFIWGNKTLQVKETALNRINVRRLLLQARKLISAVSIRLLFEQNDSVVRNQFLALVNPILDNIRTERGLTDFRVVLSKDPEDIDRNQLTGQIFLKPTRALEFIQVEFVIMNTGASFDAV